MNDRINRARAQVQTDSLTVTLDMYRMARPVALALCRVLGLPETVQGASMAPLEFESFQGAARSAYDDLAGSSPDDAFEFAAVLSALFHECRHVHDMRGTRCGAELLLHDLQVYAGVNGLLDDLAVWHGQTPGRHVPLPVVAALEWLDGVDAKTLARLRRADEARQRIRRWWNAPSRGPIIPGHSIHSLFESLGFEVQLDWLHATFGDAAADPLFEAIEGSAAAGSYLRPALLIAQLVSAKGGPAEIQAHDLSWMVVNALTASGLEESFDENGVPTQRHPGTWFQQFVQRYAALVGRDDIEPVLVPAYAVESVLHEHGIGDFGARHEVANEAISHRQDTTLRSFADGGLPDLRRQAEPTLIGTEVGIDFRDTQRLMASHPEYHTSMGYVRLMLSGALTIVHFRVRNLDGTLGDFRTPSLTASNHIGGARVASESSQLMRLLLRGRSIGGSFFEEAMFRKLKAPAPEGWGLSLRAV